MPTKKIETKFTANTTDFDRKAASVRKGLNDVGKAMSVGVVAGAAAASAGIYAVGKAMSEAVELANVQERAEAKLQAVLRATGGAAGYNFDQLKKMAGGLQEVTTYGDEVTLSAMSILATFKQVRGEGFERATKAAMDMSAVMGTDLNSSIMQIGKALNDPTKGLSMLTRVGVTFTDQQKDQIKAMQEAGDVYGAQSIILKELETQFGGTSEALRKTFAGSVTGAQNALGDLKEEVGFVITKNQFFIDIIGLAEKQIVGFSSNLANNREQYMQLAKTIVIDVVGSVQVLIESIRFMHNSWNLVKLAANGAIAVFAEGFDRMYDTMRPMLIIWDELFNAMAKVGIIDGNPLDSIDKKLGILRQSTKSVFDQTVDDVNAVNEKYDAAIDYLDKMKTAMEDIEVSTEDTSDVVQEEFKLNTQAVAGTTAEMVKLNKSIYDTGQSYDVELPQWMNANSVLTKQIADQSDTFKDLSETVKTESFDMTEYMQDRWKEGFDGIQDELANFLKTGEFSFDSILDMFKGMLAEMVAAWIMNMAKMKLVGFVGDLAGGSGWVGAIANIFSGDSGGSGSGSGGMSGVSTVAGLASKAYEMYSGKSLTSTAYNYIADYFAGSGGSGGGSGVGAGAGAGAGIGYGAGTGVYTGMGGTAIGGSSGLGASGIPLTGAGGVSPTASGYSMGSGLSSMSSSSSSSAGAGGASAGAGYFAGVLAIGLSLLAKDISGRKHSNQQLMNEMGITPEYFANVVGDSFKTGMHPVTGDLEKQMYDSSQNILYEWSLASDKLHGIMRWDEQEQMWVNVGNAMHSFELQADIYSNKTEEQVAAMVEAQYGIEGLSEKLLEWNEQATYVDESLKEYTETWGEAGGGIRDAMAATSNSLLSVGISADGLVNHLRGLGYTQDMVTDRTIPFVDVLANIGTAIGGVTTAGDYAISILDGFAESIGNIPSIDPSPTTPPAGVPDPVQPPSLPVPPAPPAPPERPPLPFASGAIVTGPTFGLIGEGKYAEMVAPLPDGPNMLANMRDEIRALGGMNNINLYVDITIDGNDLIDDKKLDARILFKADELRKSVADRPNVASRRLYLSA